ncbi:MAG: hypothetical protein KAR87_02645 [Candidatus Aenigmarchaeota archaeon]|nr:hypothetical protein [Candidatus Aenigmarchaeota archaeon]
MKKISLVIFSLIISFVFFSSVVFSLSCTFKNIGIGGTCGGTEIGIVSFLREKGTSIMPYDNNIYGYALCCDGISANIANLNYGIIPREDYWNDPLNPGCSGGYTELCNYPSIYVPNKDLFLCDRGFINFSLTYNTPPFYSTMGTYDDFYRPFTICLPAIEGQMLSSYVSSDENCNGGDEKLFVLAKKINSLVYDDIPFGNGGYAVCIHEVLDTTDPIVEILSPEQGMSYMSPNIDIDVVTNEQAISCKYSLDGGADIDLTSTPDKMHWSKSIVLANLGTHKINVSCVDTTNNNQGTDSVTFTWDMGAESADFDNSPLSMKLNEKAKINIYLKNFYDKPVTFNLNVSDDDWGLVLTRFGWFEGHRSDLNRTNLNVMVSSGNTETVSFIQEGGMVGTGNLVLNIKLDGSYIMKDIKKTIVIEPLEKKSFFASSPDIRTTGFILVALFSAILIFLKK